MAKEIRELFKKEYSNGCFVIVARNDKRHEFFANNTTPSMESSIRMSVDDLERLSAFIDDVVKTIKADKDFS